MNTRRGFTVVELIVVIVVIGILAAVVSVSYGAWRNNLLEDTVKSDLNSAAALMEQERTWNNDYPEILPASFVPSEGVTMAGGRTDDKKYCLYAYSASKPELYFSRSNEDSAAKEGACPFAWSSIAAGSGFSCGIALGKAYCWGLNSGRLGNGSNTNSLTPIEVSRTGSLAGKAFTAIAAGASHACGIADGKVYCWGQSMYYRLGDGTSTTSAVLTPVEASAVGSLAGKKATAISAGGAHTCAVAAGKAHCWGQNDTGQVGVGNTTTGGVTVRPSPVQAGAMQGRVTAIAAGLSHTCAIADTKAYCWGSNTDGQLGTGWPANDALVPAAVTATNMGSSVAAIAVGNRHSCSHANFQIWCWGSQLDGKLGDGLTTGASYMPKRIITNGYTGPSLTAGTDHTCQVFTYMTPLGRVMCWGNGSNGKLGSNTTSPRTTPFLISYGASPSDKKTHAVSAGDSHTCAIIGEDAYCWGLNTYGQLGNENTTSSSIPVKVKRP